MSATAIRQWVCETAQRLEDELGEEQDIFILAASETGKPSSIHQKTDRLDARALLVNLESHTRSLNPAAKLLGDWSTDSRRS